MMIFDLCKEDKESLVEQARAEGFQPSGYYANGICDDVEQSDDDWLAQEIAETRLMRTTFRDGPSKDLDREQAYIEGIRDATKSGITHFLVFDVETETTWGESNASMRQAEELRDAAKLEARKAIAMKGELPREHQLAIDRARGYHQGISMLGGHSWLFDGFESVLEATSKSAFRRVLTQWAENLQPFTWKWEHLEDRLEMDSGTTEEFTPVSFTKLLHCYPEMREPVLHGLLRRGETMNVIAQAKRGKSFLAGNLAWCVATGRPWLSNAVEQGRVLIIDAELHPETLVNRLDAIANAMMIDQGERNQIDILSMRGRNLDLHSLGARVKLRHDYQLIIVDALYRFLPEGTSENDNAQMTRLYNRLDEYAKDFDASIVIIHHTSKGSQNEKSVVDVGAGAGSIARATDSHLIIRDHEQDGLQVLDIATRSYKSPEPLTIKYEHPLWHAVATDAVLRGNGQADRQNAKDRDADDQISALLKEKPMSVSELRGKTGMGQDRIVRALNRLGAIGRKARNKKTGKSAERFSLPGEGEN